MRAVIRLFTIFLLIMASPGFSQDLLPDDTRFVADIELESTDDFRQLLQRANQLLLDGADVQDGSPRVIFLLHGPVLRDLLRQNYVQNREVVDLAASLSALQVVEIKACETWMHGNGVEVGDLQPFIETVPYAADEVSRLLAEKSYIRF